MTEFILHIDTAGTKGLVMLSSGGEPVYFRENNNPMDHAAFVQPAIEDLMKEHALKAENISCIAVSNGPGSYTGLRVGLASAKGLCYGWNKPLVALSTLSVMAKALQMEPAFMETDPSKEDFIVPMIDARRMEVFFGVYEAGSLNPIQVDSAAVLNEKFLENFPLENRFHFLGDGSEKFKPVCSLKQAHFYELPSTMKAFARLANHQQQEGHWPDLAYALPFYRKAFYSPLKK